jgi:hypothetical protein
LTTAAPFGVPGEALQYLESIQQELWDAVDAGGEAAGWVFLQAAVDDGRLARVVFDHITEWNRLKQTDSMYILSYQQYVLDHLDDWKRDGLPAPTPEDDMSILASDFAIKSAP